MKQTAIHQPLMHGTHHFRSHFSARSFRVFPRKPSTTGESIKKCTEFLLTTVYLFWNNFFWLGRGWLADLHEKTKTDEKSLNDKNFAFCMYLFTCLLYYNMLRSIAGEQKQSPAGLQFVWFFWLRFCWSVECGSSNERETWVDRVWDTNRLKKFELNDVMLARQRLVAVQVNFRATV